MVAKVTPFKPEKSLEINPSSNRKLFLVDQIIYNSYSLATYEIKQLHNCKDCIYPSHLLIFFLPLPREALW